MVGNIMRFFIVSSFVKICPALRDMVYSWNIYTIYIPGIQEGFCKVPFG
jgi:hypothetical protein